MEGSGREAAVAALDVSVFGVCSRSSGTYRTAGTCNGITTDIAARAYTHAARDNAPRPEYEEQPMHVHKILSAIISEIRGAACRPVTRTPTRHIFIVGLSQPLSPLYADNS